MREAITGDSRIVHALQEKARRKKLTLAVLQYAGAILVTLAFLFPLYWMLISSLKTSDELLSAVPTFWPTQLAFENYSAVWNRVPWLQYILNTLTVTIGMVLIKMLTGIMAAYSFSLGEYKGRNILFVLVLGAMMIPIQVTFIPIYVMFSDMKLTNSLPGIILPSSVSAYCVFMLRQHFLSVDKSYIEAGKMDGMSRPRIIANILVPMCKPGVITMLMLDIIEGWNMYFWPKIITTSKQYLMVSTGLTALKASFSENPVMYFNQVMAGTVITVVPIVILFLTCQKYILTGFSKAAMK